MSSLKYWIWLSALRGVGPRKAGKLLDRFGSPDNIYAALSGDYEEIHELTLLDKRQLENKSLKEAEKILEICTRKKIKILTIQDAAYPDRLKNIDAPPVVLYYRGKLPDFDDEVVIAMVGSRHCTAYGLRAAEKLSSEISRGGGIIVSGMARGIDSAAHLGAVNTGKPTVAVLGCGVDVCYPKENERLMESIICSGAVMSEYPPGVEPEAGNFPSRNRIISGLSLGVVVIEAPAHSGALITVSRAVEQNRDVFAVPGNIDSETNEGVNNLIKDGAKLTTTGADVLSEYVNLFPHRVRLAEAYAASRSWFRKDSDSAEEKAILPKDAPKSEMLEALLKKYTGDELTLLQTVGLETVHIDNIINKSEMNAPKVLSLLTMLEIKGIVRQLPGKRFILSDMESDTDPQE